MDSLVLCTESVRASLRSAEGYIAAQYDTCAVELVSMLAWRNCVFRDRLDYFAMLSRRGGGELLDVGCGFGRDVDYFTQSGLAVVGVDASRELLRLGRVRYPYADLRHGTITLLPEMFASSFDSLWCRGVLFHFAPEMLGCVFAIFSFVLRHRAILYVQLTRRSGTEARRIRGSTVLATYYYHSVETLLAAGVTCGFVEVANLSTPYDICLILGRGCD